MSNITPDVLVSELAAREPATIRVFQKHEIEFCCGGRIPLAEACARQGIAVAPLLDELRDAVDGTPDVANWEHAPFSAIIAHIQSRYHEPLREELPRLSSMIAKVVSRHGARLAETVIPLQATFEELKSELLDHMAKEDAVLFPAIAALEGGGPQMHGTTGPGWIAQPISVMEAEHEAAGEALATLRRLTRGYTPPADACPTLRGLYFGLAELERDMHVHVHLENHVLFPRVEAVARQTAGEQRA